MLDLGDPAARIAQLPLAVGELFLCLVLAVQILRVAVAVLRLAIVQLAPAVGEFPFRVCNALG